MDVSIGVNLHPYSTHNPNARIPAGGELTLPINSMETFQLHRAKSLLLLIYQSLLVNMCYFKNRALLLYCCYKILFPHILIRCKIA